MGGKAADLLEVVVGLPTTRTATGCARPASKRVLVKRVEQLTVMVVGPSAKLENLAAGSQDTRSEQSRLDEDLDESRRLNLRAEELLDIVSTEFSSGGRSEERGAGGEEI